MSAGERDDVYDLTSVLYHALQGAETADQYRKDAQDAAIGGLAAFFDEVRMTNLKIAESAKGHLRELLAAQRGEHTEGRPARPLTSHAKVEEASMESFPASDAPAY